VGGRDSLTRNAGNPHIPNREFRRVGNKWLGLNRRRTGIELARLAVNQGFVQQRSLTVGKAAKKELKQPQLGGRIDF
jgi:hypothetical protein